MVLFPLILVVVEIECENKPYPQALLCAEELLHMMPFEPKGVARGWLRGLEPPLCHRRMDWASTNVIVLSLLV